MRESVRWFDGLVCFIGLAACGYPPLPKLDGVSDAPNMDALSIDAPSIDGAPPLQFLSCAELPATCGATGSDSCCNSLEVPAGSYDRSYDLAGDGNSGTKSSPAAVSRFRLDKYEVTVGRFRTFVNAGMGTQASPPVPGAGAHAKISGSGWDASWDANECRRSCHRIFRNPARRDAPHNRSCS